MINVVYNRTRSRSSRGWKRSGWWKVANRFVWWTSTTLISHAWPRASSWAAAESAPIARPPAAAAAVAAAASPASPTSSSSLENDVQVPHLASTFPALTTGKYLTKLIKFTPKLTIQFCAKTFPTIIKAHNEYWWVVRVSKLTCITISINDCCTRPESACVCTLLSKDVSKKTQRIESGDFLAMHAALQRNFSTSLDFDSI